MQISLHPIVHSFNVHSVTTVQCELFYVQCGILNSHFGDIWLLDFVIVIGIGNEILSFYNIEFASVEAFKDNINLKHDQWSS
jgi:hypothetical protein